MIKTLILLGLCYAPAAFGASNLFVDFFSPLHSLQAEFTQKTYNENGALINTASGLLFFKRPKQLLWHTLSPNEQILLMNNNALWLIDVEIEQSQQLSLDKINQSPLYWLINKPKSLADIPSFEYQHAGIDWYQTLRNSPQYRQLKFGFKDKILNTILLQNLLDQTVVVVFDKMSINSDIAQEVFEINIDPTFE